MNLLIIPSWYPSATNGLSGIFTKEQAIALAKHQKINIFISKWGHLDSNLNFKNPVQCMRSIFWRLEKQDQLIKVFDNFYEIMSPKLHWTNRLPLGGARQLIKPNIKNFKFVSDKFGRIDLIHAHVSYPAGFIASILSKKFNVPYVLTEHMSPFPFKTLMKNNKPINEIKEAFSFAAESIAVSNSLACKISSFGLGKPKIVPNIIDDEIFFPESEKHSEKDQSKIIFLTIGGLNHQKGIDVLLKAISLWMPDENKFKFLIGGGIDKRNYYKNMSIELGVDKYIHWLGVIKRKDIPDLYRKCDIYVLPSRHETFGVVCLEAIASGKPVIATRCGGPEDIINDANGVFIDSNNPFQLKEAMKIMSNSMTLFKANDIREDFDSRFSSKAITQEIQDIYTDIFNNTTTT